MEEVNQYTDLTINKKQFKVNLEVQMSGSNDPVDRIRFD